MNDFDDVQQKAQEMTASVTNGSPAKTITPPSDTGDDSFTYSGYGEQEQQKTKTAGGTTIVSGRQDDQFAVPYAGGGSYPGAVLYGAEVHSDDSVVNLKSKYAPVEPFDMQIGNMSGKVDTLNMKKAFYELANLYTPRGANYGMWFGYDREEVEPTENFFATTGRAFINVPGQLIGTAKAVKGWLPASIKTVYGELTNNEGMIKLGNDMLEATRDETNEFLRRTTFSYGEMGRSEGENKYGAVLGSLLGSIPIGVVTGLGPASTFAAIEGLSNAYEARYAAFDRGVSGVGGLGIALAAGAGTAALGVSTKVVEHQLNGLFKPTLGWARALKENPKEFMKQALKKNFVVGAYDGIISETGQDLWTAWLGKGRVEAEDWEQAWITAMFGTVVGATAAAVKTKADKKTQQFYNDRVRDMYVDHKDFFDRIIKESDGGVTQETVDMWFDFLASGNTADGFVSYLKTKMAENMDKYDSMPEEFKRRIESIIQAKDGVTPLATETAIFDARLDGMLDEIEDLNDSTKEMIRAVLRGVALLDYMHRGTAPSTAGLPTIVADLDAKKGENPYTSDDGVIHLHKKSNRDYVTYSDKSKRSGNFKNKNQATSFFTKADAVDIANESENATFGNIQGRGKAAHELFHWIEKKTTLTDFMSFMNHLTAWTNNVLPGILTKTNNQGKLKGTITVDSSGKASVPEKQGVARSEAYAYTMEFAKSLKGFLGLEGDMRKYIELFNAVSAANQASKLFEAYNKVLSQEIKQNSATLDDLLQSYGEDRLREVIKEYAVTGRPGTLKLEDLKRLFEVMESVVDSQTIEKMNVAFGDRGTAQSFIERYEQEYDASQTKAAQLAENLKKAVREERQKRSKAIDDMGFDIQKILERQNAAPLALPAPDKAASDNANQQQEAQPQSQVQEQEANVQEAQVQEQEAQPQGQAEEVVATNIMAEPEENKVEEVQPTEETVPPADARYQYAGQRVPLAREREKAQWIERWADGEELTPEQYNEAMEDARQDVLRLIGIEPKNRKGKYILRQNRSPNKRSIDGIVTAEWNPTEEQKALFKKQFGRDFDKMSTEARVAVGHWLMYQNMKNVWSIDDDVTAITGLNSEALESLVVDTAGDEEAKNFSDMVQETVKKLDDMSESLNHSGDKLDIVDINREMPLLEEAIALTQYDPTGMKNEAAIRKFQNQIDVDALKDRIQYLSYQRYNQENPLPSKKIVAALPNDPFKIVYVSTGATYTDTKGTAKEEKVPVGRRPINDAARYNKFSLPYWINRMGLDEDKFPSVEAVESYIRKRGLEPYSFDVKAYYKDGVFFPIPKSLYVSDVEKFGPLYSKGNESTIEYFDMNKVLDLNQGRVTRNGIIRYLLKKAHAELPRNLGKLSLEQKLIEIAAIGRATAIADFIMGRYTERLAGFSEWATVGPTGDFIKGADLNFVNSKNGASAFLSGKISWTNDYILRKDLDPKNLPVGLQVAVTYANGWKQGVITQANNRTKSGRPFYIVRFNETKDGSKVKDMSWDYGEFELLQKNNALFTKPYELTPEELKDYIAKTSVYFDEGLFNVGGKDYTDMVQHAKDYAKEIANISGETVYEGGLNKFDWTEDDESALYSITDDADYVINADEIIDVDDPYVNMSNEEFENINPVRQRLITGKEATNEEVYMKLKLAEEATKTRMADYLRQTVFGYNGGMTEAINGLADIVESRKLHPMLFSLTRPSGAPNQIIHIFGDEFARKTKLNLDADNAEQVAEQLKKDVEKALLANTFKDQKELGNWQVKLGIDMADVKAEVVDNNGKVTKEAISKDEILSLYLADITKDGKHPLFVIPAINGGLIEENGFTHVYNKLHEKYKNFDNLVQLLTEQDKKAAEIIMQHLFRLRASATAEGDYFVPVNTYDDYTNSGGWANRRHHQTAVFGTRLLNPNANLVVTGALATLNNMAATAGVRMYNYIETLQTLSDMFNLATLANEQTRTDRGFRKDLEKNEELGIDEEAELAAAIEASRRLNAAVSKAIGANNFKSFIDGIQESLVKTDNGVEFSPFAKGIQQITRTASAQALSLKPRQAATNFFGNYMVFGGLSSHGALRYNTVDLVNALLHAREAWEDMKNNAAFMHRLGQAGLSEQYKRAMDLKADSMLRDLAKIAEEHGKGKIGSSLVLLDAIAKTMTKYSVGVTNTLPDLFGIALGRWVTKQDVMENVRSEAVAEANEKRIPVPDENTIEQITEERMADYMFGHVSSSNVMARGRWSKRMSRAGLEGFVAFKNDALQKIASLANAWSRLNNTQDPAVRKQSWNEIIGILASTASYVAIQSGLIYAAIRTLSGDDLNDKEKEYLWNSFIRELAAQVADAFNGGTLSQPVIENLLFGKSGGSDVLPISDINRLIRNTKKGDYWMVGATTGGLLGFSPLERAVQMTRATIMAFGDDEHAASVGKLMLLGRGESTAKNMLGLTTNKKGKIVPKKTKKKKKD